MTWTAGVLFTYLCHGHRSRMQDDYNFKHAVLLHQVEGRNSRGAPYGSRSIVAFLDNEGGILETL